MDADSDASYVIAAIEKLVGRAGLFSKVWGCNEQYLPPTQYNSDCTLQIMVYFLNMKAAHLKFFFCSSDLRVFLVVYEEWFGP